MEMEIDICKMCPEDGAWEFAKYMRKTTTITGSHDVLKLSIMCTEEYRDRQAFVMVQFGDKCVSAAHVDVDMFLAAARALKSFKDSQLSKEA